MLCTFPSAVRACYGIYKFVVVRLPLLKPSYKWKAIRKRSIAFELTRTLYRKGRITDPGIMAMVSFQPDNSGSHKEVEKGKTGIFELDVAYNGLSIGGKIFNTGIKGCEVLLDGMVLRKATLDKDNEFAFKISGSVLTHFPEKSILSVRLNNGEFLLCKGFQNILVTVPGGKDSIKKILDDGFLVSKRGGIPLSAEIVKKNQDELLQLYDELRDFFENIIGKSLFLNYGTLLGFVRNADFIPNDDDFDAGYISEKRHPLEVKTEALELIRKLLRAGYSVSINSVGRLFKVHGKNGFHLDIMPVWFEAEWNVAYRGICVKASLDDFVPVQKSFLRGCKVYIPNCPEVFLTGYYGKDWRVPDPGYSADMRQTGMDLRTNYGKYLITPLEFMHFKQQMDTERKSDSAIGEFISASLVGKI